VLGTIVTLVPIAVGFALSPVPLVELILVLFSRRRVVNSIAFVLSLMVATGIAVTIGAVGGQASGDTAATPSVVSSVVIGLLGLLLLVIGVRNWRNRADTSEPAILSTIYEMGPIPVAVLAIGISLFNPKNLPLLIAAGQTIGDTGNPVVIGIVFVIVATLPYLVAALYSLLGGGTAAARLERMRAWLIARNRLIMGILCLVLGLVLVLKAVAGLLA
jgi:hypothetical protein